MTERDVLGLREIDAGQRLLVGGKAANLSELTRIDDVSVPAGFCVTTEPFRRALAAVPAFDELLDRLDALDADDRRAVATASAAAREAIERVPVAGDVAASIAAAVERLGEDTPWAVRSSATAEDLPTASFAGQQDSYLGVVGTAAVVEHVRRCWASLFTERAVIYRARRGIDHRSARMAVVVQRLVAARASGTLFTADALTSNRTICSVEAVAGLGEALVAGLVDPDSFRVRDDAIVERTARRDRPVLDDDEVLELTRLGRRIEAHFGAPQDIEWCLDDGGFQIVQSRPITTLFPVPVVDDGRTHVYVSVGHQQMMTDAMTALGLSMWRMIAMRPMDEAGGRLFVDVVDMLAAPASRAAIIDGFTTADPLIGSALRAVVDRGGIVPNLGDPGGTGAIPAGFPTALDADAPGPDPALVGELVAENEASVEQLRHDIAAVSGPALFDFVAADIGELKRLLTAPRNVEAIMAGMQATWWLNDHLLDWLDEKNAADTLTLSAPGNVTSQMGLALMDVADVIRAHPVVVDVLRRVGDDDAFLDELVDVPGGQEAAEAIRAYLGRYGMRCVGEIDITRPRWSERPTSLVPLLLSDVDNFTAGAGEQRFERGREVATAKEAEVLHRLRALPDGERKAEQTKRMIDRLRAFIGYREYPKYGIVRRTFLYKQALRREARLLADAGVLADAEDADHLRFDELAEAVRTQQVDSELIARRKAELRAFQSLTPPRVLTSDGEVVAGSYGRTDAPDGALVGLAVSAGTVEGRARVILDLADADVEPGDILVTTATDPSWSPLFVAVAGLVTEVGGQMTHGAVIAREYGLPAVVGVQGATRSIADGRRIRVHGADGFVELLP